MADATIIDSLNSFITMGTGMDALLCRPDIKTTGVIHRTGDMVIPDLIGQGGDTTIRNRIIIEAEDIITNTLIIATGTGEVTGRQNYCSISGTNEL